MTEAEMERCTWVMEAGAVAEGHRRPLRSWEEQGPNYTQRLRVSTDLLTPSNLFWTFDNLCCLKPLSLWYFVREA